MRRATDRIHLVRRPRRAGCRRTRATRTRRRRRGEPGRPGRRARRRVGTRGTIVGGRRRSRRRRARSGRGRRWGGNDAREVETREGRREGRWNRLNIARERIQRCVGRSRGRAKTRVGVGGDCRETRDFARRDWIGLDWIGSDRFDAIGDSTWETRVSNARLTAVCAFRDVSRA